MAAARVLLVALAVAILAGCGAQESGQGAQGERLVIQPPPPIRVVDAELSREEVQERFGVARDGGNGDCAEFSLRVDRSNPSTPRIEGSGLRACKEDSSEDDLPASDPRARIAAELLVSGHRAVLVTYRSRRGGTCYDVQIIDERGRGVPLTCRGGRESFPSPMSFSSEEDELQVGLVAGLVRGDAEVIRITFRDAAVSSYPLTGPRPRDFPEHRVFMVEVGLGRGQLFPAVTGLELLRDGRVIAVQRIPPASAD